MTTADYAQDVNQHYGREGLEAAILAGLQAAGKDLDRLNHNDLAPVDQFHTRGKEATLKLAEQVGLQAGWHVLDVGGGLGGAARTLAAEFGCRVTALDMTEEYCRVGETLTARTGLADGVAFKHGSALAMPFPDKSFDVVWTQHSSMNIEDKRQLYAEIRRVLKPQGRLALHEIMAGSVQPIHFPVPWASHPAISFLQSVRAVRALIAQAGFRELAWEDSSRPALEWFQQRAAAVADSAPPLGLHLLLGETFRPAFQNQIRNLAEDRIAVIEAVFERE